jgi:hypothetical protein
MNIITTINDELPYFKGDYLMNTHRFQDAINKKLKTGYYSLYKKGTQQYKEFWLSEFDKCMNGYTIGEVRITGYHYFYLNYVQIELQEDYILNGKKLTKKITKNPNFWKLDYDWFNVVEEAEQEEKHLIVLKPRRAGWSYKQAAMGARDYAIRTPNMKGEYRKVIYAATDEEYLTNILAFVWANINYLDKETEMAMFHARMGANTATHKKASGKLEKSNIETQTGGEILGLLASNPHKFRGKSAYKIHLEEFGSFKKAKEAIEVIRPVVEEGGAFIGQIIAWGTGGEIGAGIEGLKEIFRNPKGFGFKTFDNSIYGDLYKESGFFFPYTQINIKCMDKFGNIDQEESLSNVLKIREEQKLLKSPDDYQKYVAEHCLNPDEAFREIRACIFNLDKLVNQRIWLEQPTNKPNIKIGRLEFLFDKQGKIAGCEFISDKNGKIHILQPPHRGEDNSEPPANLYIAGIDGIDMGEDLTVTKNNSEFAMIIKKRTNSMYDDYNNTYVAYYCDRPRDERECFDNALKLSIWYNCQINLEKTRIMVYQYFREHKLGDFSHKFMAPSNALSNKFRITNNTRDFGTKATSETNNLMDNHLKNYIEDNCDKIKFERFLVDASNYNPDKRGNYDIIVALGLCELADKELEMLRLVPKENNEKIVQLKSFYVDENGYKRYGYDPKVKIKYEKQKQISYLDRSKNKNGTIKYD